MAAGVSPTALLPLDEASDPLPSSAAFATPHNHVRPFNQEDSGNPSILPILLPTTALRPLAFRVFTKKHGLNLSSTALEALAAFVGKHCGSGWRNEGLAEKVLDGAARQWKKNGGGVLVLGEGNELQNILRQLDSPVNKERAHELGTTKRLSDFESGTENHASNVPILDGMANRQVASASKTNRNDLPDDSRDSQCWINIIKAFDQPRLSYDPNRRHFERINRPPSNLAISEQKTQMFRQRYSIVQQRVLRHESFQASTVKASRYRDLSETASSDQAGHAYKLTLIANLLGRGGSTHMLLGLLARSPSGKLAINDPTGSILLDLHYARSPSEDEGWFTPGMLVVVDGLYEDCRSSHTMDLDGNTGVGGFVGGNFVVYGMTGPPSERREATLGAGGLSSEGTTSSAGFGWVDFLGVGSDRATRGPMRDVENQLRRNGSRSRIVFLGEVNLDATKTLQALRKMLALYAAEPSDDTPMAVVLMGNFAQHGSMAGQRGEGSMEYKEYIDSLASTLSEFPTMLQKTTFVFVPGDNDPWSSSFTGGAAGAIPRDRIPEVLTSRIRRAFAVANMDHERATGQKSSGEAIWTTNPTRLTLFGPSVEIVVFRDDMTGRLRRNAIRFPSTSDIATRDEVSMQGQHMGTSVSENRPNHLDADVSLETRTARKLVKTVISQGHLSPFPLSQRPVRWDFSGSLHLYPLPSALILMDAEAAPFVVGLDGCHVMNPSCFTPTNRRGVAQWMEYHVGTRRGQLRQIEY